MRPWCRRKVARNRQSARIDLALRMAHHRFPGFPSAGSIGHCASEATQVQFARCRSAMLRLLIAQGVLKPLVGLGHPGEFAKVGAGMSCETLILVDPRDP